MLSVSAPAKINLTLEVLRKRPDGFHEIRGVIQTIDLEDRLYFQASDEINITSDMPEWNAKESLVFRTVNLLKQAAGYSGGVTIEVKKRIPLQSGLGGDSSDAAAVLRGLNRLWQLSLPMEKLLELAARLGSDVPFFLYGGTARLEGRGEIVTPLPPLPHGWIVLEVPPVHRPTEKTKRLYESLKAEHYTDGQVTRKLVDKLEAGKEYDPSLLFNTFEKVAFSLFPGLDESREHFMKIGASSVHLAGSGPALFTLMKDRAEAERLCLSLANQGIEPYLAETLTGMD